MTDRPQPRSAPWPPWLRTRVLFAVIGALAAIGIVFVELADEEPPPSFTLDLTGDSSTSDEGPRLNTGAAGATGDHWHTVFGVYQCDHFVTDPILRPVDWPDPTGIHTHNDNVIHIHPFVASAAGDHARLRVFFETMDLEFDDRNVELTNGATLRAGDQCNGRPASLKVAVFDVDRLDQQPPTIVSSDLPSIRLRDRQALTIALVPEDVPILPPPDARRFELLTRTDAGLPPAVPTVSRQAVVQTITIVTR